MEDLLESWFIQFPKIGQVCGLGPVITLSLGTNGSVLRFLIPLIATELGLNVIEAGLANLG